MMKYNITTDRSTSYFKSSKSLWTEYITYTVHDLTEITLIYHENNQEKQTTSDGKLLSQTPAGSYYWQLTNYRH